MRGTPSNVAKNAFDEPISNPDTHPISRCCNFHLFIRLFRIIDLYPPSPDAPSSASDVLERRSATLAYRTPFARMSKHTLIYLLLSMSILLATLLWAVETFIFEIIFSLCLSRFPSSEYIFPFFFYSRSVFTVTFSSRTR